MDLSAIQTPACLVDTAVMHGNIERMQTFVSNLSTNLRPHVKTAKSIPIANAMNDAGAKGIAVSTLKEAEEFFTAGVSSDIMYCVCIVQSKLKWAYDLIQKGCDLKIVCDSVVTAQHIASFGVEHSHTFKVLIEIDTDGHRSGCPPDTPLLLEIAAALGASGVHGVMAHAGESYELSSPAALQAMAEQERSLTVLAAERLRAAGYACPVVSVGSTPTALSFQSLDKVTEVRAGVYVFFDLVMYNIGVCSMEEIALSVLTTVIGHQPEKGWVITDAGWMAMSRDRGVPGQPDFGYGQVCTAAGVPLKAVTMVSANQEHGIITCSDLGELKANLERSQREDQDTVFSLAKSTSVEDLFPVGMQLRVLPNHACATAAQFPFYHMLDATGKVTAKWERFYGW
jgi:D-serine deaminase-like pyridoxal phosphate-dependent protein